MGNFFGIQKHAGKVRKCTKRINVHDSDEDDKSPTEEEEAQDSPGPAVTPKEFDSDVSSNLFI